MYYITCDKTDCNVLIFLTVVQGLRGIKFPRLSPILLLHHPEFLPNSVFGRTSASPDSLSSYLGYPPHTRYETYSKSKSPLPDDINKMAKSSVWNQSSDKRVSPVGRPYRDIPISPRVTVLRKSVQKNKSIPKRRPLSDTNLPHMAASSQNDNIFKRPQVYHPKKVAAEKRAVLKQSKESLIFYSAESHSDMLKSDQQDFHPDFDDLV